MDSHLHKVMYGFQVGEIVVLKVNTNNEEEASIAAVDYLEVAELRWGEEEAYMYVHAYATDNGCLLWPWLPGDWPCSKIASCPQAVSWKSVFESL